MLRAGPFSDERILRLANRRFVPFYFDLSNRGVAGDPDARAFVVKVKPEYGGRGVPTPELLVMTPEGKLLGSVSNYSSADKVLALMRAMLEQYPRFNQPSQAERDATDPIEVAQIKIDLGDYEGAAKALARDESQMGLYLKGRMAGRRKDWNAMAKFFQQVTKAELLDDVRVELARRYWDKGDFKKLRALMSKVEPKSNRYTEARYYEGLALFHTGRKKKATEIWAKTIKGCSQDPWIYRCDWAYCNAKAKGGRTMFSSAGKRTSLLNRIGYMGRKNPDLAPR